MLKNKDYRKLSAIKLYYILNECYVSNKRGEYHRQLIVSRGTPKIIHTPSGEMVIDLEVLKTLPKNHREKINKLIERYGK